MEKPFKFIALTVFLHKSYATMLSEAELTKLYKWKDIDKEHKISESVGF